MNATQPFFVKATAGSPAYGRVIGAPVLIAYILSLKNEDIRYLATEAAAYLGAIVGVGIWMEHHNHRLPTEANIS